MANSKLYLPLSNEGSQNQQANSLIISILRTFWQYLLTSFIGSNELRIWQTYDCFGNNWWHAYDPITGRHTSVDSKAEMQAWIKKHYS